MMKTTVTIDHAGRIVVPKAVRNALHLTAGTVLRLEQEGDHLSLTPAAREASLSIENGTPLIMPADGPEAGAVTTEMVNETIGKARLERHTASRGANAGGEAE